MSLINKAYAVGESRGTSLATGYYIAPNGRSIFCQNPNSEGGVHIWGGKTYHEDKVNPQWIPFDMSWALENQDKLWLLLSPTEATTQVYLESVETYISSPKATVLGAVDPSESLRLYVGKVVAWIDDTISFVTPEVAEELKAFF